MVPWTELSALIEPHYPKAGNGRPPVGLERMLRMYFVQHWLNLTDEACEEALLDSVALWRFVRIDLGRERLPVGTTLLKFRRLLEQHEIGAALFTKVRQVLQERGMKVGTGTIVEATIIFAPSSTKNAQGGCDPRQVARPRAIVPGELCRRRVDDTRRRLTRQFMPNSLHFEPDRPRAQRSVTTVFQPAGVACGPSAHFAKYGVELASVACWHRLQNQFRLGLNTEKSDDLLEVGGVEDPPVGIAVATALCARLRARN